MISDKKELQPHNKNFLEEVEPVLPADNDLPRMFEPENLTEGIIYAVVLGAPKAKQWVRKQWRL